MDLLENNMRVSILTHPLGANYGGILQAFALSKYLQNMGYEVFVLNRNADMSFVKRMVKAIMVLLHHPRYNNPRYRHLVRFVKQHIPYTKPLYSNVQMTDFVRKNNIQVAIVGSDQVWRAGFAMNYGYDYFLDFVPKDVTKLSYAASFGLSEWEYNKEQTCKIRQLVNGFNTVSVREDEGVILCRKYMGVEAEHVLDPTMLLHADDYVPITSPRIVPENYVFVYWLGSAEEKQKAILHAKIADKKLVDISLRGSEPLMPVEDWLSYIKYADQVVTDSFHGCVFSILFGKQFSICTNNSGGYGRLRSLFSMLGIDTSDDNINYESVYERLQIYRRNSYTYIDKALK